MESVGFAIRVQAMEGYADKLASLVLPPEYVAVLAVKHHGKGGENAHYHAVVRTIVKPQAFRVRMKNLFADGKGNEHMSIKQWDGSIDALSYLFHEEPDTLPMVVKGITQEFMHEIKANNKRVQKEVVLAKGKSSHLLLDVAYEHFSKLKGHHTAVEIGAYMLLNAMINDKYPPNPYLLRSMVTLGEFRLLNGDTFTQEQYCLSLAQKIISPY